MDVGIFYGTSTGSTGDVADLIFEAFGDDIASEPMEIEEITGDVASSLAQCKCFMFGNHLFKNGLF